MHTPGPWTAQGYNGPINIVSLAAEHQQVVAQMIVRGSPMTHSTAKANARLIAAAPALWEALKRILRYAESYDPAEYGGKEPTQEADIAFAREAINMAKGKK